MNSSPFRQVHRDTALLLCGALCLGLIVAWVSVSLRFGTRADTVYNLAAVLRGRPLKFGSDFHSDLPFYNRILFAAVHQAIAKILPLGSPNQWYLLLRILAFQAAFVAFAFVCHRDLSVAREDVFLASALLALATIVSFDFAWEDPSDALDLLALALGVGAATARRFVWCLALSIAFAANRESAAYLGVIWFVLTTSPTSHVRRSLEGGAICMLSYGMALVVRALVTRSFVGNFDTLHINLSNLMTSVARFNLLDWPFMLIATTALLFTAMGAHDGPARRFVALAGIFVVPAFIFGLINELRVFLPCFIMLAFAIAVGGRGEQKLE